MFNLSFQRSTFEPRHIFLVVQSSLLSIFLLLLTYLAILSSLLYWLPVRATVSKLLPTNINVKTSVSPLVWRYIWKEPGGGSMIAHHGILIGVL